MFHKKIKHTPLLPSPEEIGEAGASVVAGVLHPGTLCGQSHTPKAGLKTVPSAQFCDVRYPLEH